VKIVLCNAPPESAEGIARTLVTERLAACVNLLPVRSIYRWEGVLQEAPEVTLVIRVSMERFSALRDRIRELHTYALPEIVVLDVDLGASHAPYVSWVRQECAPLEAGAEPAGRRPGT
jgi:periplasmic divalent cation tolerance protein